MSLRELSVLIAMCLVWGFHFLVIKLAVTEIPPMFYAAIRMTLVAILMARFLRWRPGHMKRVFAAGICLGALNYAFMFTGVKYATASTAAIAMELYVPFATILSVLFLGETVGWKRSAGILLAFAGVAVIALSGDAGGVDARIGFGVGLVAAGAFSEATGAIFVKQSKAFKPFELLAWFSLIGSITLWVLTAIFEDQQLSALSAVSPWFVSGAVLYSALGASIFGHSAYYWLLQRLPVSLVAPSALLTTLTAVFFGVLLLGDPFGPSIIVGGLMTIAGVGFILLRTAAKQDAVAPVTEPEGAP